MLLKGQVAQNKSLLWPLLAVRSTMPQSIPKLPPRLWPTGSVGGCVLNLRSFRMLEQVSRCGLQAAGHSKSYVELACNRFWVGSSLNLGRPLPYADRARGPRPRQRWARLAARLIPEFVLHFIQGRYIYVIESIEKDRRYKDYTIYIMYSPTWPCSFHWLWRRPLGKHHLRSSLLLGRSQCPASLGSPNLSWPGGALHGLLELSAGMRAVAFPAMLCAKAVYVALPVAHEHEQTREAYGLKACRDMY